MHVWASSGADSCSHVCCLQVTSETGKKLKLYFVLVGVKGDWVYLRTLAHNLLWHLSMIRAYSSPCMIPQGKAHQLSSGFTSTRKCHFCSSKESLHARNDYVKLYFLGGNFPWPKHAQGMVEHEVDSAMGARKTLVISSSGTAAKPPFPSWGGALRGHLTKCIHGTMVWEENSALRQLHLGRYSMHAYMHVCSVFWQSCMLVVAFVRAPTLMFWGLANLLSDLERLLTIW